MDYKSKDEEVLIYDKMDYNFETPICAYRGLKTMRIKEVLNGSFDVSFTIPLDEKSDLVKPDNYVKILGDYFKVIKTNKVRTRGLLEVAVMCEHVYFEIIDDYLPYKEESKMTIQQIVDYLNRYTTIKFSLEKYITDNISNYPPKVIEIARGNPQLTVIAALTLWDLKLEKNGRNAKFIGSENLEDIQLFRHQKNLSTLNREEITGRVTTRLYAYGYDDLTIKGLNPSTLTIPKRISGDKVEFLTKDLSTVIGSAPLSGGTISSDYLDSRFINNYPQIRKGEFVDISIKEKDDLLNLALLELRKIEATNNVYTLSVEEMKHIHGDVDSFGLGHQAIIMDEELLSDYVDGKFQAPITEYDFFPFDKSKPSTVKIGSEQNIVANLFDRVNKIERKKTPKPTPPPEPEGEACKLLAIKDFTNAENMGGTTDGGTYSHNPATDGDCVIIPKEITKGSIKATLNDFFEVANPSWILKVKGGLGLTSGESMFRQTTGGGSPTLKVDISEMRTNQMKSTRSMFRQLSQKSIMRGIELIDFNNVIDAYAMFYDNQSITKFDGDMLFNSLENMESMFEGCSRLKYLDLSKVKTKDKLNYMQKAFRYCRNLKTANLTGLNFKNVIVTEELFRGCSSLTSITFPDGEGHDVDEFNIDKASHMKRMFQGCESLEKIDYESFKTETHIERDISYMFSGCKKLKEFDLTKIKMKHNGMTTYDNYVGLFENCEELESIGNSIFTNYPYGEGITFSDTSANGRTTWLDKMFKNTPKYKGDINLFDFVPTSANEAFVNCGAEKIYVNKFTGDSELLMSILTDPKNNPNGIPVVKLKGNPQGMDPL